jgi:DNA-binding NtrC family response regulator
MGRPARAARAQETALLADDNYGVRDYTKSALEELGHHVVARLARQAFHIIDAQMTFDLLFTGVALPGGISGRQLANKIVHKRADLPVVFTTGYTRNATIHHGRLNANVNLLQKPCTQQDLVHKIRQALDNGVRKHA